ncbi:MAG: hypothetical protein GX996_06985 [Firmicutes bacterium]|nr:hypothetical protein [Bacillota bacterium]
MALEESLQDQDLLEENDGVSFVYEKDIAPYISDKVIDFQAGPQGGFSIKGADGDLGCDGCSYCG